MSSLTCGQQAKCPIRHMSFNQDFTCIAIGCTDGIRVYNIENHRLCYKNNIGAVSITEMLFCTSLMAFVGAGEQPALTPRKLTLFNTSTSKTIQDVNCASSVLAVRMNRLRLVIVLEKRTFVHTLDTLQLLRTLETPLNPKGIAALTECNDPNLLALPASASTGTLRVYDLQVDGGNVRCEISAHKTPLGLMAWNHDGTLLASASTKGTVIRVHRLPHAQHRSGPSAATKAYTFRRGSRPATIHSLAFSPPEVSPTLLAASSSHGTIHVFRLEDPDRHPAVRAASAAAGLLSAVVQYSVTDMVDPPRNIATVKLPSQNVPAICAIHYPRASSSDTHTSKSIDSTSIVTDSVVLVVASAEGLLYQYIIDDLRNPQGPKCALEGEWLLLGSSSSS